MDGNDSELFSLLENLEDRNSSIDNDNGTVTNANDNNKNRLNIIKIYSKFLSEIYTDLNECDNNLFIRILNKTMFFKGLIKNKNQKGIDQKECKELIEIYNATLSLNHEPIISEFNLKESYLNFRRHLSVVQGSIFENCKLSTEADSQIFFSSLFGYNNIFNIENLSNSVTTVNTNNRVVELGDYYYFWFVDGTENGYRNLLLMYNKEDIKKLVGKKESELKSKEFVKLLEKKLEEIGSESQIGKYLLKLINILSEIENLKYI